MSCKCSQTAVITATLAAGSTGSPYFYELNVSQKLCKSTCAELVPSFSPAISVLSVSAVGTGQYMVTCQLQGVVNYIPCNGTPCCTQSQLISQQFSIPIASGSAPTSVTVVPGTPVNGIAVAACQNCSKNFVSEIPLTVTVS